MKKIDFEDALHRIRALIADMDTAHTESPQEMISYICGFIDAMIERIEKTK